MDDDILALHLPKLEDELADMDLQDAIDQLPTQYKSIIILRFFEDLQIDEIAEITGVNVNTVKTRLYTALRKLELKLGRNSEYEKTEQVEKGL